jgi:hypothetical protein
LAKITFNEDVTPTTADEPAEVKETDLQVAETAIEALREMGVDLVQTEDQASADGGFTLAELERVVANLQVIERAGGESIFRGQWSQNNGKYTLIGNTLDVLPPGYYDMQVDNVGTLWFEPVRARGDRLLRFPDAATDKIVSEIETFWAREEVYQRFGLPHKRGILLYGPPGSGKTCTLQLLARDVVKREGIVLIYQPEIFIHAYRQIRHIQPETPIVVLMEDLDATLKRHDESTVLNTLDGADTIEKTVFVATTNYPELLGERIINRPSRFDRRLFVGDPSPVARKMYLDDLIQDREYESEVPIDVMVRDTEGMSLAHVKELFVMHCVIGAPYKDAIYNLKEMHFEQPASTFDRDKYHSMENIEKAYR